MKVDAFYMSVIEASTMSSAVVVEDDRTSEEIESDQSTPNLDLILQSVPIESENVDEEMAAIEAQPGFKNWIPENRDRARTGVLLSAEALALDSTVSNVELHALARLARQVSGLNEVRLVSDEHRERLSAQQLEYSNKLAAAVAGLCERTVGAAFESFGLPRCGSPVPVE